MFLIVGGEGSSNRNASRDESVEAGDKSVEAGDESIEAGEKTPQSCYNMWQNLAILAIHIDQLLCCWMDWYFVAFIFTALTQMKSPHKETMAFPNPATNYYKTNGGIAMPGVEPSFSVIAITQMSDRWQSPRSTLRWRHNERDGVSNNQPHDCLLISLFGRKSKKTSKFRVTGLCAWNSPVTGEFPAQRASNAENVSIWWRHHKWIILFNCLCSLKLFIPKKLFDTLRWWVRYWFSTLNVWGERIIPVQPNQ